MTYHEANQRSIAVRTHCPPHRCLVCSAADRNAPQPPGMVRSERVYSAGQAVAYAGQPLDIVGTVISGTAAFTLTMSGDRRQIVNLAFPTQFIGWPGRGLAPVDITAVTYLRICTYSRSAFEARLQRVPLLRQRFMEARQSALDEARDWLIILGRHTALEQVASLLVVFARQLSDRPLDPEDSVSFVMPLSRADMADCLGMSSETVSRQLGLLRRDRVIVVENKWTLRISRLSRLLAAACPTSENLAANCAEAGDEDPHHNVALAAHSKPSRR